MRFIALQGAEERSKNNKIMKLASVITSWKSCAMPHSLYMWTLIDINTQGIVKFFLFYKNVKFHNITREGSALKTIREWVKDKRKELQLSCDIKGQFFIKRYKQENSKQIKGLLGQISNDFHITYVDNLPSQGVVWEDTLLKTLANLEDTPKYRHIFEKMLTLSLTKKDVILLKEAVNGQLIHGFSKEQDSKEININLDKLETSMLNPQVPSEKLTWLSNIGEQLEEWGACEDDVMSHKPTRRAWTEAMKIKRKMVRLQPPEQDVVGEQFQKLSDNVQDIKNHLVKKKRLQVNTKPLRDSVKYTLYQALMQVKSPRYTRHAHLERARKRILFTLLYYTGARVNELRHITYEDIKGVLEKGHLKLVLHKQKDAIVRVLATVGHEEIKKLTPEINLFFNECQCQVLGQSFRRPGQVMHQKAWISYVNKEIQTAKESLQYSDVLSSHSFRVAFVTRHLKHADSHLVANIVGHKNIGTTLKYNRYVVDQEKQREILDKAHVHVPHRAHVHVPQ